MRALKRIVFSAAVVAVSALFVTAELIAQTTCTGGVYTVNLLSVVPGTNQGTTLWNYNVTASGPNLNKISEVVMVIPRPVKPLTTDIISPAPTLNYCQERDSSTKINRGNCGGFPLPIGIAGTGNSRNFTVTTSDKITPGIVSVNIVSGSAGNDICFNSDLQNLRTGILGPGNVGDPSLILQTARTFERTNSLGDHCSTTFNLDSSGNVVTVTQTGNGCPGGGANPTPFAGIQININNGGNQTLRQLGRFDDFVELLAGVNSSCSVTYRGVLYTVC